MRVSLLLLAASLAAANCATYRSLYGAEECCDTPGVPLPHRSSRASVASRERDWLTTANFYFKRHVLATGGNLVSFDSLVAPSDPQTVPTHAPMRTPDQPRQISAPLLMLAPTHPSNDAEIVMAAVVLLRMVGCRRLVRCKRCACCRQPDCGYCKNCADKPRFGGPGERKRGCDHRPACPFPCARKRPRDSVHML